MPVSPKSFLLWTFTPRAQDSFVCVCVCYVLCFFGGLGIGTRFGAWGFGAERGGGIQVFGPFWGALYNLVPAAFWGLVFRV